MKPAKTIDEVMASGKNAIHHPGQTADRLLCGGKNRWQHFRAEGRKTVDEVADSGREIINGLRTDVDLAISELKTAGDTAVKKIDIRPSLRRQFDRRMQKVPQLLNLPSRSELTALNKRMASVVTQVERLNETNG